MPAYSPYEENGPPSNGPFSNASHDQKPIDAHLTPEHAFPPTADSEMVDPEHARGASLLKSDSTDSEDHHHHAEQGRDSCASCRAKGMEPFQGHVDKEEGCPCAVGEGAVPTTAFHGGNAGKGGSQHGGSFLSVAPCHVFPWLCLSLWG